VHATSTQTTLQLNVIGGYQPITLFIKLSEVTHTAVRMEQDKYIVILPTD